MVEYDSQNTMRTNSFQQDLDSSSMFWHNPADINSYRDFLNTQKQRVKEYQKAERQRAIGLDLKKWNESVPPIYRNATLESVPQDSVKNGVKNTLKRTKKVSSFYIHGDKPRDTIFTLYAIVSTYIKLGAIKPSQILTIDESSLVEMAQGGFRGQESFVQLKSSNPKVILLTGLGDYGKYDDKVSRFIEGFISYIFEQNIVLVTGSLVPFKQWLTFIVSPSSQKKVEDVIGDNIVSWNTPQKNEYYTNIDDFGKMI